MDLKELQSMLTIGETVAVEFKRCGNGIEYSFDFGLVKDEAKNADKVPINADKVPINNLTTQQKIIFDFLKENTEITSRQAEELLNVKQRRARVILGEMVDLGIVERQGAYKSTIYVLSEKEKE